MSSTTVSFNLKTAGFANYANQTLSFRLLTAGADKTDDTVILPGVVTATSAADGTGSVSLFRNGESDINSVFEVIFPNREKAKFIIPSGSSSIHLSDLLVDHVPSGSDTQQSSVFDAAIQRANHTGDLTLDSLPNGSITGTLAVANGGTNASSASAARTSLGAQEQKDVLDDLGALSAPASDGQFIVATGAGAFQYETTSTARTSLGLGTIATQASNSVDIDGGAIDGAVIGANSAAAGTFAALTSTSINVSDGNITNAGDINCDSISADDAATGLNVIFDGTDTGDNKITLTDNLASALDITESTNSYLKFTTTNSGEKVVIGKDLDISGTTTAAAVTGTNVLSTATLGYKVGSGGTVTQNSSKSTAVTLNNINGEIVMNNAALADDATAVFTFNNNTIAATDVVIVNVASVGTAGAYQVTVGAVAAGSCSISVLNVSGGSLSQAIKLNFAVIKAVAS